MKRSSLSAPHIFCFPPVGHLSSRTPDAYGWTDALQVVNKQKCEALKAMIASLPVHTDTHRLMSTHTDKKTKTKKNRNRGEREARALASSASRAASSGGGGQAIEDRSKRGEAPTCNDVPFRSRRGSQQRGAQPSSACICYEPCTITLRTTS